MERLTHDAYVVQITRLGEQQHSEVEELLDIFRQERIADAEGHMLNVDPDSPHSKLITDIIRTLGALVAEPEVQQKMALKDEMYLAFAGLLDEETRKLKRAIQEAERAGGKTRMREERKRRLHVSSGC